MAQSSPRKSIVIVGAGIIGLDVALILAERGFGDRITVIAEHLPGDTAPHYTSPWAGCNFSAISGRDQNALRWDKLGYAHLSKLASQDPSETFVYRTPSIEYWDDEIPHEKIKDMAEYLEKVRSHPVYNLARSNRISIYASSELYQDKLPDGAKFGVSFTTLAQYGVRFVRQKISNIHDPFSNPRIKVIFNCVGNAARTLAGVEDPKCYPTRGQVLLVRAPQVRTNVMRHGRGYETYMIPRPQSNGNVILGGYMQKGNDDSLTYSSETESIINRTKALSTELSVGKFEILAAFSGLRPSREGGARIERSDGGVGGESRTIVHNYGAGGTGFQAGYGMATEAMDTIDDILREWDLEILSSKL